MIWGETPLFLETPIAGLVCPNKSFTTIHPSQPWSWKDPDATSSEEEVTVVPTVVEEAPVTEVGRKQPLGI